MEVEEVLYEMRIVYSFIAFMAAIALIGAADKLERQNKEIVEKDAIIFTLKSCAEWRGDWQAELDYLGVQLKKCHRRCK